MVSATDRDTVGQPVPFDLCGDQPVLDFVNTLENRFNGRGRVEGLRSYQDLLRFAGETRILDSQRIEPVEPTVAPAEGVRALRAARALREALASIFYAVVGGQPPPSDDLETLERHFLAADRHRELRWRQDAGGEPGLAWSWRQDETDAELPVWALALAARDLLLSPELARVRACEADTCRWLFLDKSKSHTRRWCKMKVCGNRMKARRYQARHAD